MKQFEYVITDPEGIHARPAGMLVKEASKFQSEITIEHEDKNGDAKRIFAVMALGIKSGNTIKVKITGKDEDKAYDELKSFFQNNL